MMLNYFCCCFLLFFYFRSALQLKAMKLKELANDIKTQRQLNDAKGKKVLSEETKTLEKDRSAALSSRDQVKMDEM